MYSRIIFFFVLFFISTSAVFAGWHLEDFENDLPEEVQRLVLKGDIRGAEKAKEKWYRDTHGGDRVDYGFSISDGNLYITCSNGWDAYYPIPGKPKPAPRPPAINGLCGTTGDLTSEISGGSCTIGTVSGFAVGSSNPKTYSWSCSGMNGGAAVSCNASFTHPECDTAVSNTDLKTTTLATGSCKYGIVAGFVSSTDATGKTTYDWTCVKTGGVTASCKAYYKPLCVPSATNGCCDDRRLSNDPANTTQFGHPPRLVNQCQYSVIPNQPAIGMTGSVLGTQDGSTVVYLTGGSTQSNNGVAGTCQVPVDGKPRIICDADPFTSIDATISPISRFTLPSTVTQSIGSCRIIFDAPDVCSPREDTISTRAVVVDCDPTISDINNAKYCPRTVTENVCVQLTDKFGNPINDYVTGSIVSVLGPVEENPYFEQFNGGRSDPTIYKEGMFSVVTNNYCAPVCNECDPRPICTKGLPLPAKCEPIDPPRECNMAVTDKMSSDFCPCTTGDTRAICQVGQPPICTATPGDPTKCDDVIDDTLCIPTADNNFCGPPKPITIPGCGEVGFTGDANECIEADKACTAHLEVYNTGANNWSDTGDSILYDEPSLYRIIVDGADPVCRNGIISVQSVSATGGALSGSVTWNTDGTFVTTVTRNGTTATPTTSRGPSVQALFTQPGGITYGLTANSSDFSIPPTPLTITGDRMKGVRIIGNSAGTDITLFNLNNAGVIGERVDSTAVSTRNAIIKNAALLTRGIQDTDASTAEVINNILYIEGDINYSTVSGRGFRTLIVKGTLTIDTNISDNTDTNPITGIIVLKNDNGTGGNTIVRDGVDFIRALVFADGTFRGESTTESILNPKTQLVLKGTLFSRNTVGGSADPSNLYTSGGAKTTDPDLAFIQDLNNVRNGYGCRPENPSCHRGYADPFIIEYENSQGNPPPGFSIGQ